MAYRTRGRVPGTAKAKVRKVLPGSLLGLGRVWTKKGPQPNLLLGCPFSAFLKTRAGAAARSGGQKRQTLYGPAETALLLIVLIVLRFPLASRPHLLCFKGLALEDINIGAPVSTVPVKTIMGYATRLVRFRHSP